MLNEAFQAFQTLNLTLTLTPLIPHSRFFFMFVTEVNSEDS